MNLINNWLDSFHYNNSEINYLNEERTDTVLENSVLFEKEKEKLFNKIPFNKFKNKSLSIDINFIVLIQNLFNKFIDDNTLIITTDNENCLIKKELNKYKNIISLFKNGNYKNNINLKENLKNFKKVFIYIVGFNNNNFIYNTDVIKIQNTLKENNIEFITVLDATKEMFMLSRDYSIYDYVISSTDFLIPNYNLGMLFGSNDFGRKSYNWIENFNNKIDLLFREKWKFYQFNNILSQYFSKYTTTDKALQNTLSVPFVYNLIDCKKRFINYNDIEYKKDFNKTRNYTSITFNSCQSLIQKENFINKIKIIDNILNK